MPAAAAVLGIAGAFATTSMSSSKTAVNWEGHQYVSDQELCSSVKMCQTENSGELCRVVDGVITSPQLKGKLNPSDADCPLTLYRIF